MEYPGNPLSLLIGKIVRHGAEVERSMRQVWLYLVGPSLASRVPPGAFAIYATQCQAMLKHAEISDESRQIANDVIFYAKAVWDERNRAVHDIWIEEDAADTEFVRQRLRKNVGVDEEAEEESTLSVSDIEATIRQLHVAVERLQNLAWALRDELPSWQKGPPKPFLADGTDGYWAIASGENAGPFGYMKLRASLAEPDKP